MTKPYLSIQGIRKTFGKFVALSSIDIDIQKNEFICLLGPSGCGKTTLLRILAGLEQPTSGRILVGERDITTLPPAQRNFGMMFQSYALFPNLTAAQNIAYGLLSKKWSKKAIEEKVREVLVLIDLEHIRDKYPSQLSGGQQQRVALARAIALSPDFLLLDEPLSALDAKVRLKLRRELRSLHEKIGITTIMVTHDQDEALTMADRIVVMNNAEVVQVGSPQEVYERPNSPFVADFVGAINFLEESVFRGGTISQDRLFAIRPENIHLMDPAAEYSLKAMVQDLEFRGSFYRVTLQLVNQQNGLLPQLVTIDLPVHQTHRMGLSRNKQVAFELPMENLISFDQTAVTKKTGSG
ncbi:putative 2-aminoethylphosphonate ABC transporter ATP-binding protein [Brevibacillus choshinensis]|uniref:putative 2-aminoethylphosphonate ABC transporter ATP-binding protein n=1 Tax=Brevibacillus choshinensis TaxID=54911 RepID=UPI002E20A98F|nr:putative 2-aminoethylphosphonate ABC transporter ATP-binding protein [Brevibacillus choshinensis]MED4751873.1 putative 2-aminoethylphosphonate ABC transporter ATP-binding protein [Brevibacillus choshinensis]